MLDETAERFVWRGGCAAARCASSPTTPTSATPREYLLKEREQREANHIPRGDPVLFLEVTVRDASEFAPDARGHAARRSASYRVLQAEGVVGPERDRRRRCSTSATGPACSPHVYFGWTEGNPLKYLARFILFGEGDIAPVTHEILRRAEPDPERRPAIHVG